MKLGPCMSPIVFARVRLGIDIQSIQPNAEPHAWKLAPQERTVVRGQHAFAARALPADERGARIAIERRRARRIERIEVRARAEVGEEQEPSLEIARQHRGRVHTRVDQKCRNADKRPTVFLGRRSVHRDQRPHGLRLTWHGNARLGQ